MTPLLQVLITVVALGSHHPVTYMLPHQYSGLNNRCQNRVNELFAARKKNSYQELRIECVPAVGLDA